MAVQGYHREDRLRLAERFLAGLSTFQNCLGVRLERRTTPPWLAKDLAQPSHWLLSLLIQKHKDDS